MKSKKAAIGATITWTVATIIILFIIILFIYSSHIISKEKNLEEGIELDFDTDSNNDAGARETLFAVLNTMINGKDVKGHIITGNYPAIRENVENLLNNIEIRGKAFVYVQDKKVSLNKKGLRIK